ncbi:MAG: DUF4860 domain-containing protein [Clostridiales bacterium]|jgi:hypothetical protein|nr:DUF4860 domain-containing protein [Clostridiales bacterium]
MSLEDENGSSLIELIMVMSFLILFGYTIFSLIYTGSDALNKIEDEKNAQVNARIAMSYLNVRLRQNDATDSVAVEANSVNGQNSVVLKYRDPEDPSSDYDTWIFWADGILQEVLSDPGEEPEWSGSNEIVEVKSYDVDLSENGVLTNTIKYTYNNEEKTMSSAISLRSWKGEKR